MNGQVRVSSSGAGFVRAGGGLSGLRLFLCDSLGPIDLDLAGRIPPLPPNNTLRVAFFSCAHLRQRTGEERHVLVTTQSLSGVE
jgi:hypothetical protein